MIIINSNIKSK